MKQNRDEANVDRLEQELMALDHDHAARDAFSESKLASSPVDAEALLNDRWTEGIEGATDTIVSVARSPDATRSRRRRATVVLAAVAILLPAVLVPMFWGGGDAAAGAAFARMQEQIRQVRSVQYTETESFPDQKHEPPIQRRVYILGRHLERTESDMDKTIVDRTVEAVIAKVTRQNVNPRSVMIWDTAAGRCVSLYPDEKRFVVLMREVVKDKTGRVISKEEMKPNLEVNFYERIRTIPAGASRELGESEIEGKQVIGFAFEKRDWGQWKRSEVYWVDSESRLPVRIETRLFRKSTGKESQRWVHSDFVFDQALDRSLFDTNPPEGYTVEEYAIPRP